MSRFLQVQVNYFDSKESIRWIYHFIINTNCGFFFSVLSTLGMSVHLLNDGNDGDQEPLRAIDIVPIEQGKDQDDEDLGLDQGLEREDPVQGPGLGQDEKIFRMFLLNHRLDLKRVLLASGQYGLILHNSWNIVLKYR